MFSNRGYAWWKLGAYEKARADYDEAMRLDPKSPDAVSMRGIVRTFEGDFENGIADCNEAIRLAPQSPLARSNRGFAFNKMGQYESALADFEEAIRLDPQQAVAYRNRGVAHSGKRDYAAALADFAEAIRVRPVFASAYEARSVLLSTCLTQSYRNGQQAIEDATKACELHSWKIADDLFALAAAYAEAGDFNAADSWWLKADELKRNGSKYDETS